MNIPPCVKHYWNHNLPRQGAKTKIFYVTSLLVALLSTLILPLQVISAATSTDKPVTSLGAVVGYGGYYKKKDWVPVTITIHHVGSVRQASLNVTLNQTLSSRSRLSGRLSWPIRLPTNGWMSTQIDVPGTVLSQGATVSCVAGGKTLDTVVMSGNAVTHVALVAVLSKTNQGTQFLAGTSTSSNPVLPVAVNPARFPQSVNLLDDLSAVVASPSILGSLTAEQAFALHTWIELGGLLIVPGTSGDVPIMWAKDLPLHVGAKKHAKSQWISDFAGATGPMSKSTLSVQVGSVSSTARLLAGTNEIPILASQVVGRGQIWQTAFSPTDPELLAWSGDPQLWTTVFNQGITGLQSALPGLFDPSGALSLTSVGDALAPLRVPSLPFFAVVFGLYILVIGPIAFLILRRSRRAHLAWWVLPVLSAVTTVSIYLFGGAQRPKGLLADGVGVLDLTGSGSAESYGVQAFMSPYPGGLDFTMPKSTLAVPMSVGETRSPADASVHFGTHTTLAFRNVERWHVRYVYAVGVNDKSGEIATHLQSAYGMLFGTVKNDTPYTLNGMAIVLQDHLYHLGTVKPGQTVTINPTAEISTSQWISDYGTYNRALTRGIGRALGAYLTQFTPASTPTPSEPLGAMILATTAARTPQLPDPLQDKGFSSNKSLVLVRQYAQVNPEIGDALS